MTPKRLLRVFTLLLLLLSGCTHRAASFSCHQKRHEVLVPLYSSTRDDDKEETRSRYRPGSLLAATVEQGRVPYGESSRKYRRTVFTHDDWLEHRSTDRVLRNLQGIFLSGVVRQLQNEVALVSSVAAFVIAWNGLVVPYFSAVQEQLLLPYLVLPSLPFTLSSPALGLLLVFRTNSSYGRWLEARMTWGKIITQSRNLIRMAATFYENDDDDGSTTPKHHGQTSLEKLSLATWAFSRTIMNKLSGPEDEEPYKQALLAAFTENPSFVTNILAAPDRAMAALMELSLVLNESMRDAIDEKRRVEIDKSIVLMGDAVGSCERIYTSPVPLVYTRHTARFLSLWMLLVPTAMYESFATTTIVPGADTLKTTVAAAAAAASSPHVLSLLQELIPTLALIPTVAIMALFLFGIEELAVQLEEPFSILPMQRFCDVIEGSARDMLEWKKIRSSSSSSSSSS